MARKLPKVLETNKRASHARLPKQLIVIVCEGKKTEPSYFRSFKKLRANNLTEIKTIDGAGVPLSVVQKAVEEKCGCERQYRKSGDSFDRAYEVWAVFDIDQHPKVDEACTLAKANGVQTAVSNPCFEVWALLHFEEVNQPKHRHQAQKDLTKHLASYHHEKAPEISATDIDDRYEAAVRNSIRVLQNRVDEQDPFGNPSTTVHELTQSICKGGKLVRDRKIE